MKFFTTAVATLFAATSVVAAPTVEERQSSYICNPSTAGQIISPRNGQTYTRVRGNYNLDNIEVIYCSAQQYKAASLGLSVGVAHPEDATSIGQVIAFNYQPSTEAGLAQPGYTGYHFNVSLYPDPPGVYNEGARTLTTLEYVAGQTIPYQYIIKSETINFVVVDPPA